MKKQPGSSRLKSWAWWLSLITLFLLLAISYSQITPFNKGFDEGINLDYIEFIAIHGRLPVTYAEREIIGPKANWPALYHILVAGLGHLFNADMAAPPQIKIFWDSFRYQAIDTGTENTWYLHTEDQEWPYYGSLLVLRLGRWLSILFSLLTLFLVYFIALELLPDRPGIAWVAMALLGFIPVFIFTGSVLNEDALVALLATFYFLLLIRIIKYPENLWRYGLIGVVLGLSITVKYTTVILPVEIGLLLVVITRQYGYSWLWGVKRMAVVATSTALGASWWFGWNLWFLNEVEELGLIPGLLRPVFTGGTDVTLARLGNFFSGGQIGLAELPENTAAGTFSEWLQETFLSFWGITIGGAIPFYPFPYIVISLLLAVILLGLWRLWHRGDTASRRWLALMLFHISLFIILPLVRFGLSRRLGQTAQGRHILIPAAAAIVILMVWGLAQIIPLRWQRWLFPALIIGLVTWNGAHLYRLDTFVPPPLPMRTLPQAAAWELYPVEASFSDPHGGKVELVSYDIKAEPEQGWLRLNLAWRSISYSNQSYLLKVTMLDDQGQAVSYWEGYHGDGRLPSLAWDPGDVIFDRLALPLPSLPAGDYTVQVQLVGNTGPLPVNRDGLDQKEPALALSPVSLIQPAAHDLSRAASLIGPAGSTPVMYEVWRAGGPAEPDSTQRGDASLPGYRYPATISVVTSTSYGEDADLNLQLVNSAGHHWPATQNAPNVYTFVIGPRWSGGNYQLQMVLRVGNEVIGQTVTEPLLKVENWWQRHFELPEIATPVEANFANQVKFLGYKLPQRHVKAGEAFPITLYWQASDGMAPQADFTQFNHLLDDDGLLRGGYDRRPLEYYSTLLWAPGEIVIDGYAVPVEADAPPGDYYLNVGYYLRVGPSAVSLPLVVDGQMTETSSVTIGPVTVLAP